MARKPSLKEVDFRDLGFGTRISSSTSRLINPDGTFNVRKTGGGIGAIHPFQILIAMPWWKFWLSILIAYVVINSAFALVYLAVGIQNLSHGPGPGAEWVDKFAHGFYFSVQTITTLGYGTISPENHTTSLISSFEAMLGLMAFSLGTGVLYGRFARPSAKIRFSQYALIAPYEKESGLMVRIVNRRSNQLIELSAQVFFVIYEKRGKKTQQRFYRLPLERNQITLFPLNWTIVHPIDKASPMHGKTKADLIAANAEFLVIIKGYDDTFAQTVHARYSYKCEDLIWGAKFEPMYYTDEDGMTVVEIDKIDDWTEKPLEK
ncbi:MAG: ion channel [Bacteroidota bacterium]